MTGSFSVDAGRAGLGIGQYTFWARVNPMAPLRYEQSPTRQADRSFLMELLIAPGCLNLTGAFMTRFKTLPSFGLFTWTIMMIPMMLMVLHAKPPQRGLRVRSIGDLSVIHPLPGTTPVLVIVRAGPRYYLEQQEISAKTLPELLKEIVSHRQDKVVYVQGERNADFGDIMVVVDASREAQAKAVLVTSRPDSLRRRRSY